MIIIKKTFDYVNDYWLFDYVNDYDDGDEKEKAKRTDKNWTNNEYIK